MCRNINIEKIEKLEHRIKAILFLFKKNQNKFFIHSKSLEKREEVENK